MLSILTLSLSFSVLSPLLKNPLKLLLTFGANSILLQEGRNPLACTSIMPSRKKAEGKARKAKQAAAAHRNAAAEWTPPP